MVASQYNKRQELRCVKSTPVELNLATASTGIFPTGDEQGMALFANVSSPQFASLHNFIEDAFEEVDLNKPQAYLVYIYFNKDSLKVMPQFSGIIQVDNANELKKLEKLQMSPTEDGFLYTYVTNRSEGEVFFDNLTIKYWKPVVRVQYNYYPYGLPWENPAAPDATGSEKYHDYLYQDKEFQFRDFADGNKGLMLYDFHARMYDPTTAMWSVPDPAAQFSNPYLAMGNNPVNGVDPDGKFTFSWLKGFIGGFFSTSTNRWDAAVKEGGKRLKNELRIYGGLFEGNFGQIVSRFTWELPQTIVGLAVTLKGNEFARMEKVGYFDGATIAKYEGEFGGFTIGNYINGDNSIEINKNNQLFAHEYGHYLQSQASGWTYLYKYGRPSLRSANRSNYYEHLAYWTEQDASLRARAYFEKKHLEGFSWDYISNPIFNSGFNSSFDSYYGHLNARKGVENPKWWEHALSFTTFAIFLPLFN